MEIIKDDIKSSNIDKVRFITRHMDEAGTLRISFSNGSEYDYMEVPSQVAIDFLAADSQGKYFFANIRDQYLTERVEKEDEE